MVLGVWSLGPVGIFPRLLVSKREDYRGRKMQIFVSSLATSEIPEDSRVANINPLFKKRRRAN